LALSHTLHSPVDPVVNRRHRLAVVEYLLPRGKDECRRGNVDLAHFLHRQPIVGTGMFSDPRVAGVGLGRNVEHLGELGHTHQAHLVFRRQNAKQIEMVDRPVTAECEFPQPLSSVNP